MKSLPGDRNREYNPERLDQPKKLRIWAFRAVDNPEACERFVKGHQEVLENHGVTNVVTAQPEWANDDHVWVVLVDSPDGKKTYGGARVHKASGTNQLPIQEAISYLDPSINEFVKDRVDDGIGEICGLWNSLEVAGMGVGSVYLIRAGLSLANQLGIQGMFAFCSPYTYRMAASFGFFPLREIGESGKFSYPTDKLIATVTYQEDTEAMVGSNELESASISELREQPFQQKNETARNGIHVEVIYELNI